MSLADHLSPIEVTQSEQIYFDDRGGLRSTRFDDIYFYPNRGLEETRHVFIEGNRLAERWRLLNAGQDQPPAFSIVELGFGTGLNFLTSAELWLELFSDRDASAPSPTLYYFSTEKYPLTPAALSKVYQHCGFEFKLARGLLAQYPDPIAGSYCLTFQLNGCRIVLVLLFGDSLTSLLGLESYPYSESVQGLRADAWFMDGFAPSQNSDMWSAQLCRQMALLSHPETTLATFSVARSVRDHLALAGFDLRKQPGYGSKRDMLTGRRNPAAGNSGEINFAQRHNACLNRWHIHTTARRTVAVIGAGIAGSCTAYYLAKAGSDVTVFDAAEKPGGGASGNPRGILFARTGKQRSALSDLHEACFHYAVTFYRQTLAGHLTDGLTGMLKLSEKLPDALIDNRELVSRQQMDQDQASAIAGLSLRDGGIFYPDSGCIAATQSCQELVTLSNARFFGNASLSDLQLIDGQWQLGFADCELSQRFDQVVICAGYQSATLRQTGWLPIKPIRGQSSRIPASSISQQLKVAICDKGYIAPAKSGLHDYGATFNLHDDSPFPSPEDESVNLKNAQHCFTEPMNWAASDAIHARVGFRATTPDYLPIAGPLSDPQRFNAQFSPLARNAKQACEQPAELVPGLFVNTGYGSHGFTLAPLISFALAAQMLGLPLPISDRLRQAVAPNRFLLRALIRGQAITSNR